jgi:hypothetical protein
MERLYLWAPARIIAAGIAMREPKPRILSMASDEVMRRPTAMRKVKIQVI